jgi:lysophospholipase L1-like esterase
MAMSQQNDHQDINFTIVLIIGCALIILLFSVLYNEWLLPVVFKPNPPYNDFTISSIRLTQVYFALTGLVLILIAGVIRRIPRLETLSRKGIVPNIVLAIISISLPLFILELSLRPLILNRQIVTIFVEDDELGWRLKPNAEGMWGGAQVKINGKGLIGPELNYLKPHRTSRLLYLGDSVTFGFGMKNYQQSFPYITETILETQVEQEIETINAGVGGYSPWQEYIYLSREGVNYEPDLIIVSFVLNDVTEKFRLAKFGGSDRGAQLETIASGINKLAIGHVARTVSGQIMYGSEVQEGAQQKEILNVRTLINEPNRPDVQQAWDVTLKNLEQIIDFAKEKDIPIVIVLFPFAFQFDDTNTLSTPQDRMSEFALKHEVPVLDLLPLLTTKIAEEQADPKDYFLDADHLTLRGNKIVANMIAEFILQENLIPSSLD